MTDTYRALCAELLQELCCFYKPWDLQEERYSDAMKRARAALAEQPVAPMDKLDRLIALDRDDPTNTLPVGPADEELWAVGNDDFRANCYPTDAIHYARAVLARWGQP